MQTENERGQSRKAAEQRHDLMQSAKPGRQQKQIPRLQSALIRRHFPGREIPSDHR
jgi:hypothetical protein